MEQRKTEAFEEMVRSSYDNIIGITVFKNGNPLYEKYFHESTAADRVHVYSVTKSVVSILIGIALDKGYLKSIDCRVLDFFPEYTVKRGEKTIQNITLRNLLTMTAPYKYKVAPYIKYFTSGDAVKFTLDLLGGKGAIGEFRYTPLIGPDILSGILRKATGRPVLDFAAENLFSPLGITVERSVSFQSKEEQMAFNQAKNISGWVADQAGTHTGAWGLTLSPVDMAKLGQLYLDGGKWNGEQLVSANWVQESTREQSRLEKAGPPYGYLWWVLEEGFAAMGDGGNIIYVNTQKNLVISIAALFKPRVPDRIGFIQRELLPLFGAG